MEYISEQTRFKQWIDGNQILRPFQSQLLVLGIFTEGDLKRVIKTKQDLQKIVSKDHHNFEVIWNTLNAGDMIEKLQKQLMNTWDEIRKMEQEILSNVLPGESMMIQQQYQRMQQCVCDLEIAQI